MKKCALALVLTSVVLTLIGCQPAADTNKNLAAAPSPAKETFDPAVIETELIKLEREWANSAQTHNVEAVKRFVADEAVIVYPDGTVGNKAEEVRTIESGAITADSFEMLDPKVTVLNADTAYMFGRSILKNAKYKMPGQKTAIDISGEYRFLNIYNRRDGKWFVVASQTTKIDPQAAAAAAASPSPAAAASPAAAVPATSPAAAYPSATKTP
jgi:hypothetical protein